MKNDILQDLYRVNYQSQLVADLSDLAILICDDKNFSREEVLEKLVEVINGIQEEPAIVEWCVK